MARSAWTRSPRSSKTSHITTPVRRTSIGSPRNWPRPAGRCTVSNTQTPTSSGSAQRRGIDDEAVPHIAGEHALVGLVDVIRLDDLDFGPHVVLAAEVKHLLGFRDAADHRTGQAATHRHQWGRGKHHGMLGHAEFDEGAVDVEQA